jgi:nucleotide-binding universal stress UspA family protein
MITSILVPLDGSPFSEHALPLALGLARRAGVPLRLVHVHVPLLVVSNETMVLYDDELEQRLRDRKQGYLDEVVKRIAACSTVSVSSQVVEGAAGEALEEVIRSAGASLVVMTTHGKGPVSRFWLGSVADQLIRRASVPILLVPAQTGDVDLRVEPSPGHVLVPLDGSALAEGILEPAIALGKLTGADYTLVRIIERVFHLGNDALSGTLNVADERRWQLQHDDAQIYLSRTADRMGSQELRVSTHVVSHYHPATAILEEARSQGNCLIAIQTHGRGGLARLLLGSAADKVVRGATSPVLIGRPAR